MRLVVRYSVSMRRTNGRRPGRMKRGIFLTPLLLTLLVWAVLLPDAGATSDGTVRVSVSTLGAQGSGASYPADISASGRYVLFSSDASNLVTGDTNSVRDVFVRDR